MVYPSMRVLPMGWISLVAVVQCVVRTLVFREAGIPVEFKVAKTKRMPEGDDLTVIYLDSYGQLRKLDKGCHEVLEGTPSERHRLSWKSARRKASPSMKEKGWSPPQKAHFKGASWMERRDAMVLHRTRWPVC